MLTQQLVGEAMARVMRDERLPPPALEELQQRRLRDLLQFAIAHSPFYARLYRSLDVARAPLTDLPTVTKKAIQEHFDEVVTDPRLKLADVQQFSRAGSSSGSPWFLGAFAVLMSSGTSGQRGYYVWDGPALADAIAVGYRQSNRSGSPAQPPSPQRIAAVMLIEPFDAAGMLMRMIPESVGPKEFLDIRQDFSHLCEQLNAFQPTVLSSFPYMLRLLSGAAEEGRLTIQPTRITSSGDVLTESDRTRVRMTWGVEPHDYYCSTEVPYIAWECDEHDGLHVNADSVLVESVDAAGRPVPPGRLGDKLFLTNLANRAMPLLRYEMSDQVEFTNEPCRCGCQLPRIRKVAGRVEHILTLPGIQGGRVSLIPEHLDDFVGGLAGLANYQVIQETSDRLTVNFISRSSPGSEPLGDLIRSALAGCFQRYGVTPTVQIDLAQVEQLEPIRPGSRKVCHYWNRSTSQG